MTVRTAPAGATGNRQVSIHSRLISPPSGVVGRPYRARTKRVHRTCGAQLRICGHTQLLILSIDGVICNWLRCNGSREVTYGRLPMLSSVRRIRVCTVRPPSWHEHPPDPTRFVSQNPPTTTQTR